MTAVKPQVVCFSDRGDMVDLIKLALGSKFEISVVTQVTSVDDALNTLRRLGPEYVLVDPRLPGLDHQWFYRSLKADQELKEIQILVISDDEVDR